MKLIDCNVANIANQANVVFLYIVDQMIYFMCNQYSLP